MWTGPHTLATTGATRRVNHHDAQPVGNVYRIKGTCHHAGWRLAPLADAQTKRCRPFPLNMQPGLTAIEALFFDG